MLTAVGPLFFKCCTLERKLGLMEQKKGAHYIIVAPYWTCKFVSSEPLFFCFVVEMGSWA